MSNILRQALLRIHPTTSRNFRGYRNLSDLRKDLYSIGVQAVWRPHQIAVGDIVTVPFASPHGPDHENQLYLAPVGWDVGLVMSLNSDGTPKRIHSTYGDGVRGEIPDNAPGCDKWQWVGLTLPLCNWDAYWDYIAIREGEWNHRLENRGYVFSRCQWFNPKYPWRESLTKQFREQEIG